jgi:hypothetical protein
VKRPASKSRPTRPESRSTRGHVRKSHCRLLEPSRGERGAWFAALGEPLTEGDRSDANAYAVALGLGALRVVQAHDWPEAERILKAPDWSPTWWDREEALRQRLLADAEALSSATVDGAHQALPGGRSCAQAATASRMGSAAKASIHVAAGAAPQAAYQLRWRGLPKTPPRRSKEVSSSPRAAAVASWAPLVF